MHNLKTIKKSHKSYEDAISRFAKKGFINLSLYGSGYTNDIRREWETYGGVELLKEADDCYINIASLFDYSTPKMIEKSHWLYKDSFIKLSFSSTDKFCTYYMDGGKLKKDEHKMTVYFYTAHFGVGEWKTKGKEELIKLARKCNKQISDRLIKAIESADKEIATWNTAVKKQAKVLSL